MASAYSNVNLTGMNRVQLKAIARNLVIPQNNATTNAALVTAIKAK